MTDKMREEFEAWFCSTIPYPIAKESWFAIMSCDDYIITEVQAAWAVWQASRAALCVELPVCRNESHDEYFRELSDELDMIGIKYK